MKINEPIMAILPVELIRVLMDYQGADFVKAFEIAKKCFKFELGDEFQEKVYNVFGKEVMDIYPRHAQILNMINLHLIEQ